MSVPPIREYPLLYVLLASVLLILGITIHLAQGALTSFCCGQSEDRRVCYDALQQMSEVSDDETIESPKVCFDGKNESKIPQLEGYDPGDEIRWENGELQQ